LFFVLFLQYFLLLAQLPHGIASIRRHIKEVDNVPLLVSLFSDCTPANAKEMIKVQQENDEIVCCVGCSTCADNPPLFAQANVSIAVDPSSSDSAGIENNRMEEMVSSFEAFTKLLSFPCAFHFTSGPTSEHTFQFIFHLIKEARHMTSNFKLVCKQQKTNTIQQP